MFGILDLNCFQSPLKGRRFPFYGFRSKMRYFVRGGTRYGF
jgi:hypothetical protein